MQKSVLIFIFMLAGLNIGFASQISAAKVPTAKLNSTQNAFIYHLLPKILTINQEILSQRSQLLAIYQRYQAGHPPSQQQQAWLRQLASRYSVSSTDFSRESTWNLLLKRVDMIPPSLVLAQAINESAWGTSRFATLGNNYFGVWCYKPGCGIVPMRRPANATYEVRKYPSAEASINHYIHILNTVSAYSQLRVIRQKLRQAGEQPDAIKLASGLLNYSAKGEAYVRSIQGLIRHYQLIQLVQNYQQTGIA